MEYRHSSHGYITIKYTQINRLNQDDQSELVVLKNTFKKQLTEIDKRLRSSTWNKIKDDQDIRRVILQLFKSFYYQIKQERNKTKSQKRDHSVNNETLNNKQMLFNKQTQDIFHKTILKNQFLMKYLGALDSNQFSEAQQLTKNPRYTEFTRNNEFFTRFDLKLLEYQQIKKLKFQMQKLNQNNTCYEDILLNIDKSYFLQQKIDIPENRKIIERLNTQLYYKIQQNCLQTKKIDQYSKVISRYSSIITRLNQKLKSYNYSNAQLKQILKTSTLFQNSFKKINIEDCNKQLQELLNNLYQKQTKCILNQQQKDILKQNTIQERIHMILKYFCSILSSQSNQNRIRKFKEFSKNLQDNYKDNRQIKDSLSSIGDIFQKTKFYEEFIDQILKIKSVSLIQKNKTLFEQIDSLPYSDIKKKLRDIYQRNIMSVLVKENIQTIKTNEQKLFISQIPKQIQGLLSQKIRSTLRYIKKKDQNQNVLLTLTKNNLHQAYKLIIKKQYKQEKSWSSRPVIQDINRCVELLLSQVRVIGVGVEGNIRQKSQKSFDNPSSYQNGIVRSSNYNNQAINKFKDQISQKQKLLKQQIYKIASIQSQFTRLIKSFSNQLKIAVKNKRFNEIYDRNLIDQFILKKQKQIQDILNKWSNQSYQKVSQCVRHQRQTCKKCHQKLKDSTSISINQPKQAISNSLSTKYINHTRQKLIIQLQAKISDCQMFQKELSSFVNKIQNLQSLKLNNERQISNQTQIIGKDEGLIRQNQMEINRLKQNLFINSQDLLKLQSKLKQKNTENKQWQNKYYSVINSINQQQNKIKELHQVQIPRKQQQISQLNKNYKKLNQSKNQLLIQLNQIKNNNTNLKEKQKNKQIQIDNLKLQCQALKQQNETNSIKNQLLQKDLQQYKNKQKQFLTKLQESKTKIQQYQIKITELQQYKQRKQQKNAFKPQPVIQQPTRKKRDLVSFNLDGGLSTKSKAKPSDPNQININHIPNHSNKSTTNSYGLSITDSLNTKQLLTQRFLNKKFSQNKNLIKSSNNINTSQYKNINTSQQKNINTQLTQINTFQQRKINLLQQTQQKKINTQQIDNNKNKIDINKNKIHSQINNSQQKVSSNKTKNMSDSQFEDLQPQIALKQSKQKYRKLSIQFEQIKQRLSQKQINYKILLQQCKSLEQQKNVISKQQQILVSQKLKIQTTCKGLYNQVQQQKGKLEQSLKLNVQKQNLIQINKIQRIQLQSTIAELNAKLKQLEFKIKEIQTLSNTQTQQKSQKLNQQFNIKNTFQSQLSQLRSTLLKTEVQIQNIKNQLQLTKQNVQTLNLEKNTLQSKLVKAEILLKQQKQKLSQLLLIQTQAKSLKIKNQQQAQQINKLQSQINKLQNNIENYQNELKTIKYNTQKSQKSNQSERQGKQKTKQEQFTLWIQKLKANLQNIKTQSHSWKCKFTQADMQLSQQQQRNEKLKDNLKVYKAKIQSFQDQNKKYQQNKQIQINSIKQKYQDQLKLLNQSLNTLQNDKTIEITKLKELIYARDFEVTKLNEKMIKIQNKHQQQIAKLTQQRNLLSYTLSELNHSIQDLKYNNQKITKRQQTTTKRIKQLQQKLQAQSNKRSNLNKQVQNIRRQKSNLQLEIKIKGTQKNQKSNHPTDYSLTLKLQIDKLKKQLESQQNKYKNQIKSNQSKLKLFQQQTTKLKQQSTQWKKKYKQLSTYQPQSQCLIFDRFFPGLIMQDLYDKKYQLYNLIKQQTKRQVKTTRLIYRYDLINPNSFHVYVDGIQNILLIVKTKGKKSNIFGSFSTAKIQKDTIEKDNHKSFIFTFNPQIKDTITHYPINYKNDNCRSLSYDDYFLIVGNSEIRLRFGQTIVYSNFGINNGFYQAKGDPVEALLMAGDSRQVEIEGYQCFQVVFK